MRGTALGIFGITYAVKCAKPLRKFLFGYQVFKTRAIGGLVFLRFGDLVGVGLVFRFAFLVGGFFVLFLFFGGSYV